VPVNAVLFDLGSTLMYFDGDWEHLHPQRDAALMDRLHAASIYPPQEAFLAQFNAMLRSYYTERDTEFIEQTTAYLLRLALEEWDYIDVPDEAIRDTLAGMYAITQAHWKAEEDAQSTLDSLKARGYRLGLISNAGDDADVQTLIDQSNLRGYFDFILTSAALGIRKPNPRIFQTALDHWGIPASQAAMVGDSLGADILGARNAGIYGIWITRRADTPANRSHEDTILPDVVITTLAELIPLLDGLR
jgi:2-haloalkanoic acid dehalogenase type II